MKRLHNNPLGNDIWFDGVHYWRGSPGKLVGPYTESELHFEATPDYHTGDDSTRILLEPTTLYPK